MPARRTPLITGQPFIATPRAGDEGAVSRGFDNTRERIEALEREVLFLGQIADANSAASAVVTLQRQMTNLSSIVNSLLATVSALGQTEDNDGQLAGLIAEAAELKKAMADINTAPPSGTDAALTELIKRVDGLEQGVLS